MKATGSRTTRSNRAGVFLSVPSLSFLLPLLAFPILWYLRPSEFGFPLDDAWIFTVFAENLRVQGDWAFNPGEGSAGVTSLLWTRLLAWAGYWNGGGTQGSGGTFQMEVVCAWLLAFIGGFFPLVLALPRIYHPALEGGPGSRRWLAAALAFLALVHGIWFFHLYSGMETALFVGLGVLAIVLCEERRYLATGIVLGLLVLTRIEGSLLAGILCVFACFRTTIFKSCLAVALAPGLAVAATLFHNWRVAGTVFPTTFAGRRFLFKLDPDQVHIRFFGEHLRKFVTNWFERIHEWVWMDRFLLGGDFLHIPGEFQVHPLALVLDLLMVVGGLVLFIRIWELKRWRHNAPLFLFFLWTVAHNLFYVTVLPTGGHAGRYQAMNFLWPPLLAFIGGRETVRLLLRGAGTRVIYAERHVVGKAGGIMMILILLVPTVVSLMTWKQVLESGIHRIDSLHIEMGSWARENTIPAARVVVFDLGAFKMASERYVIDQSGLLDKRGLESFQEKNSPTFYRERRATHLFKFERLDEPDLIIDPIWKTDFVLEHRLSLDEEFGLDREAVQNTWSRCSLYRIVYSDQM